MADQVLRDKVAIITGASRGIGRALAVGFAQQGASVVAAARTETVADSLEGTVQQIVGSAGNVVAVVCDLTRENDVRRVVDAALTAFGRIDVLVNNAGVNIRGPTLQLSTESWDHIMAVNLRGPFLMCKHVLPVMMRQGQGNVINITSSTSQHYVPGDVAYSTSKAALNRFTLNLAEEVRPHNIAVNLLTPGLVASYLTRDWSPSRSEDSRRPGPAQAVVPAAVWLACQDAATFTGRMVSRYDFGNTWGELACPELTAPA